MNQFISRRQLICKTFSLSVASLTVPLPAFSMSLDPFLQLRLALHRSHMKRVADILMLHKKVAVIGNIGTGTYDFLKIIESQKIEEKQKVSLFSDTDFLKNHKNPDFSGLVSQKISNLPDGHQQLFIFRRSFSLANQEKLLAALKDNGVTIVYVRPINPQEAAIKKRLAVENNLFSRPLSSPVVSKVKPVKNAALRSYRGDPIKMNMIAKNADFEFRWHPEFVDYMVRVWQLNPKHLWLEPRFSEDLIKACS